MSVFSQEKYIQHTVSKGETISEIAQHYNVNPAAVYDLNPDARNGIKWKTVLLIPTKAKKNTASTPEVSINNSGDTHEVLSKETLYGITKKYNVSIENLYKINPNLEKEGLKAGQMINIPQTDPLATNPEKPSETKKANVSKKKISKEAVVVAPKTDEKMEFTTEGIIYEVLPKESLYSIAKKYGITLADVQKVNPKLGIKALKVGQKIIVPVKEDANSSLAVEKKETKKETKEITVLPKAIIKDLRAETEITREVLPKESLYSIAKQYGITVADLQKANPILETETLKAGQKIIVPVKGDFNSNLAMEKVEEKKEIKINKNIAVLPPPVIKDKKTETEITHEVLPKETKYGIAKEYGLTVAELEKQNPNIVKNLPVGYLLKIRSSKAIETKVFIEEVVAKEESEKKDFNSNIGMVHDAEFVDRLIMTASENIGTRYRSGGITKDGFDCSGLMCATFGAFDIKLPRTSIEMASYGSRVDTANAQKGDLIFFKTNGRGQINHVGMVVEILEGEIKFIHSSSHGGVIISSTKESYYERCFVQVNRVL